MVGTLGVHSLYTSNVIATDNYVGRASTLSSQKNASTYCSCAYVNTWTKFEEEQPAAQSLTRNTYLNRPFLYIYQSPHDYTITDL